MLEPYFLIYLMKFSFFLSEFFFYKRAFRAKLIQWWWFCVSHQRIVVCIRGLRDLTQVRNWVVQPRGCWLDGSQRVPLKV